MDYRRESGGDVVHVIPTSLPPENWIPGLSDASVWATEEDYNRFGPNPENSGDSSGYEHRRSGSEQPPNKKVRNSQTDSSNRAKAIGKMFFKTKLCCKFRAGTCPYITNCNFAHSVEELRRPPPNWQEIVAAHEEEKALAVSSTEPREEYQIPSLVSSGGDAGRSYKGRHCKKFYTEEGCPYGDTCTFLHDEASRNRESVAISLGPGGYSGSGGGGGGGGVGNSGGVINVGGGQSAKPSNWKTRICNKWELTGYCPFGSKCHFAHGTAELHRYAGGSSDIEAKDALGTVSDSKQGVATSKTADTVASTTTVVPHPDVYHLGVSCQRPTLVNQKAGQRKFQKWKGPDKISRIYGDWIDDVE